ncbi:NAD(P)-dependent dehydrogenase (short-subunit alcohol dehydrogenase family) [Rhizobium mesoamericanum]|nr:hypothetical protein [Rhizobium mesoamericanum]MDQ0564252.1 NAD(P)-dependent dehydrogenase (short-subunit alcohol dehydrogenase family) [Rhizobium mesoamericanum]
MKQAGHIVIKTGAAGGIGRALVDVLADDEILSSPWTSWQRRA